MGSTDTIGPYLCISASTLPNIGQWVAPNGNAITDVTMVTVGGADTPGLVTFQAGGLSSLLTGVHTCLIPDEAGIDKELYLALYPEGFNSK